jgi:predicted RNase H-like nuclease (RuvC/YqgF family)
MSRKESEPGAGPAAELERALERERAANRDLVRKCAELDAMITRSQHLAGELRREGDRLRAELAAARRADPSGGEAGRELRRLRAALARAHAELDRLARAAERPENRPGTPAKAALRRLRTKFAKDYHPDHAPDPRERLLRQEVFKHVWGVFDELEDVV